LEILPGDATIAFFIPRCLAIYRNTERISRNALLNLLEVGPDQPKRLTIPISDGCIGTWRPNGARWLASMMNSACTTEPNRRDTADGALRPRDLIHARVRATRLKLRPAQRRLSGRLSSVSGNMEYRSVEEPTRARCKRRTMTSTH
jgi:hypothetical protein